MTTKQITDMLFLKQLQFLLSLLFNFPVISQRFLSPDSGNDQMKVDNFAAAVEFYSKAIAINPQNAVYYCNRSAR